MTRDDETKGFAVLAKNSRLREVMAHSFQIVDCLHNSMLRLKPSFSPFQVIASYQMEKARDNER
jgi:hypothetical protein